MATQQEIEKLYQDVLGRSPDTSGLSYWQNYAGDPTAAFKAAAQQEIASRPATTSAPVTNTSATTTSSSPAAKTSTDEITKAYWDLFGRLPDAGGLQYWQNSGLTGQALTNAIKGGASSGDQSLMQQIANAKASNNFDLAAYLEKLQNDLYTQSARATAAGNLSAAQTATAANRVNQVTPFGNLIYSQTGVDAQGNPIWTATQNFTPEYQKAFGDIAGQVSSNISGGFNPNLPSVGINPGETYYDAIMRRLEPVQARQRESLEVDLANQGIMPGSEAYNRAKEQLSQSQNDQRTSAVVGGFNTGLAANQQGYNQALTNYQLPIGTLSNLRSATNPSYVNPYNQVSVAGPDYLSAYNAEQQNLTSQNNANTAASASKTGGLLDLGGTLASAAILSGW